jgi:hypothetical protein
MAENRVAERYRTSAGAAIPGILKGDSKLINISITGCCVECTSHKDIKNNKRYRLEIIPESAAEIEKFTLLVECKWIRDKEGSSQIGFSITSSPKGKAFKRYVDYLAYRSNTA